MLNIVMFINQFKKQSRHTRKSKTGKEHTYTRDITYCVFRCDNCDVEFTRPRGSMDPKRLTNNYFHVCSNCDAKKFAQKKGVEKKQIWNVSASSDMPIGRL
jgi:hypothetical protein|tara:strand:- start:1051 stop:1353 length:303 start_codon:yes stop_codon:yes gene_type:complete